MDRRNLIAAMALWVAAPRLAAAQGGWLLLGRRLVNWSTGRDSLIASRAWPPLSALSFTARGREIVISTVEVSYARGGRERIPVNLRLRPNLRSGPIRLRSMNRDIRRIDFSFRPMSPRGPVSSRNAGSTTLEIFGRR